LAAALMALATAVVSLAWLLRSAQPADWVMAGQVVGTAGIAGLLLFGIASASPGVIDLALLLALLAAFAAMAFSAGIRMRFGTSNGEPVSDTPSTQSSTIMSSAGAEPGPVPSGPTPGGEG
jgi:multicomponent Na+:H+ antiporter subunit F